jgi:hypothetical protein
MSCAPGCERLSSLKIEQSTISKQPSAKHEALCDPLPTEQLKRKNQAEIGQDWTVEKHKKMASTAF